MTEQPDLVVLGGGSGGYAAALRAAELGLQVSLVEKGKLGGTCLHRGCIPTKAILHAAEVADGAREGARFGVHATVDKVDLAGVSSYARGVVSRLYKGLTGLVASRGITVVAGEGRLVPGSGVPAVAVTTAEGEQTLTAPYVVLASGSQSKTLPGLVPDGERVLTSTDAIRLETLPTSAIVLGGGVIGVELASAWRSFGVEVTVVEADAVPMARALGPEMGAVCAALHADHGVRLVAGHTVAGLVGENRVRGVRVGGVVEPADVVVVGIGAQAAVEWLAGSGVAVTLVGDELERHATAS